MNKAKKVAMVLVLAGCAALGFGAGAGGEEKDPKTLEEVQKTDTCDIWITPDGMLCWTCTDLPGVVSCSSG